MGAYRYKMARNVRVNDGIWVKMRAEEADVFYPSLWVAVHRSVPLVVSSVSWDGDEFVFRDARSGREYRARPDARLRVLREDELMLACPMAEGGKG